MMAKAFAVLIQFSNATTAGKTKQQFLTFPQTRGGTHVGERGHKEVFALSVASVSRLLAMAKRGGRNHQCQTYQLSLFVSIASHRIESALKQMVTSSHAPLPAPTFYSSHTHSSCGSLKSVEVFLLLYSTEGFISLRNN